MGCSICLEGFTEEDVGDTRPACLPCGHLYHLACAKTWLQTSQRDYCPLCGKTPGKTTKVTDLLSLYPSAPHDVNAIQAAINSDDTSWMSALKGFTHAEAHQLFDNLTDLTTDLQTWISATVGVRVVATKRAGEKVYRLIAATANDEEKVLAFEEAMLQLDEVIQLFDEKASKLDEQMEKVEKQRSELAANKKRFAEHIAKHNDRLARAAAHEAANETRSAELRARKEKLLAEQEAWADTKKRMEVEVSRAKEKALESAQSATRAHVEARQTVAAKEIEVQRKKTEAEEMVAAAVARQREAEAEREETRAKNNALAETMRTLQRQLQEQRNSRLEEKKKRRKEQDEHHTEVQRLQSRLTAAEAQLRTQGPEGSDRLASRHHSPSATDLLQASPVLSRGHKRSTPSVSSVMEADGSMSLVIEMPKLGKASRRGADDGWDSDEVDSLPMPGMPRHRGAASLTKSFSHHSSLSMRQPLTTKCNSVDTNSSTIGSLAADGVPNHRPVGKLRRTDPATADMSKRSAAGPRQRVKEGGY
ncbi:hypothetical protein BCV69DRAFT_283595 [Microstroma glucosiphilum]|uniref:RING-type domain-containing protein n=1 Tax=Pseudomicrostroma glucosiphilum TaxID=1684307 RepID=A0A316U5E9_9BASI|nr:hypothetical protein BCV69DRAFT_283595 [Pseudomicrostroma glucosiphilum]PWN20064.1 hypothetical protein BCV69DRAFT_283595 [Pseudomicrostroma glucosiphilum]